MKYTTPFSAIDVQIFPDCYRRARQTWFAEIHSLKCRKTLHAYLCDGEGPYGEELVTDTVLLGDPDAQRVLVVIGGTHGIEGFAGSAIQIDLLRLMSAGRIKLFGDISFLLIHALTPWGYAWLRRCDAGGVDLNRNVVDFSGALPENPDYARLKPVLYDEDSQRRSEAFNQWARLYGRESLESAISKGQYCDPGGPFYGGAAPCHGRRVVEDLIEKYSLRAKDLAVIDLHTGLGSYGYGEIICDHPAESAGARIAHDWYGDSVTLPELGTSSSVPKYGLLDYAWHAVMNANSCYVTLEFGTYPTDNLFEVLIRDHLLWAKNYDAASKREQGGKMRHHFCPDDRAWRELVLFRARQVAAQALQGLVSL